MILVKLDPVHAHKARRAISHLPVSTEIFHYLQYAEESDLFVPLRAKKKEFLENAIKKRKEEMAENSLPTKYVVKEPEIPDFDLENGHI